MSLSPGKLALTGGGLIFMWSGLRGASVTGTVRDLVSGKTPHAGINAILAASNDGSSGSSGNGGGGAASNSQIASDAMKYDGAPYGWGKADAPHGADCSGLLNDVCGRDLGLPIPGIPSGKFTGHGPVAAQWFTWNGLRTIPDSEMQAGDIVCWLTHCGVVIGKGRMISALNYQYNTLMSPIQGWGPAGEPHRIRRYK